MGESQSVRVHAALDFPAKVSRAHVPIVPPRTVWYFIQLYDDFPCHGFWPVCLPKARVD